MRAYIAIGVVFFTFVTVVYAVASEHEKEIQPVQFQKTIKDINRLKPLQNPRHERSAKILDRLVMDNASMVVGKVDDVMINSGGSVTTLVVDFKNLQMPQPVFLDYDVFEVKSMTSGYKLGFDKNEIERVYASLLASIESAAGDEIEYFSTKGLIGSQVLTSDGYHIGDLDEVLFDQSGTYFRSVYVMLNFETIQETVIAVPLSILSFRQKDGRLQVTIDQKYANLIIENAKGP